MYDVHDQSMEPTLLGAAWQYRWLVLFLAIGFAGLGWLYGNSNEAWTATATITVEDPRTSGVFEQVFADTPERYVTNQAEIAGSRTVLKRSIALLAAGDPPIQIDIEDLVDEIGVGADGASDEIDISYTGVTGAEAIAVVNAVADAYQDVATEAAEASFTAALEQLDRQIVDLEVEFLDYREQIDELRNSDPNRLALQAELDVAIAKLLAFDVISINATPEEAAAATALLGQISTQIDALQDALATDVEDTALLTLQDQQAAVRLRLSDLQTRRDQLAVDAELASDGVVLYDPAETAQPTSGAIMMALGLIGGGILGSTIALLLARRRRRFGARSEPERVFGVRLLSDVPSFYEERLDTRLPVVEAPASASAESFRFVAAAIALQQEATVAEFGDYAFKSLVIASPSVSEGKTTVTANTAYAAARGGKRVLVVDADLANQELSQMLYGSVEPTYGLTDVIRGEVALEDAIVTASMEEIATVDLLSRGSQVGRASDFMSSERAAALFAHLGETYDLVLIDAPPVLQVAYATTLVRLADRALIVVSHGQDYHGAEDLKRSMDLIGSPMIGYVYNQAPLRRELALRASTLAHRQAELEHAEQLAEAADQDARTKSR
ncbi:MAG: AAA family ATPase [Acidimicrobiia bacterium]|nr:AAA family ATPase [Acidimicrobiia bacterium]